MKIVKPGDIVQNARGWQGEVIEVKQSDMFGLLIWVQYASTREWESRWMCEVVARAGGDDSLIPAR